jgi:uncharacterized protein YegP (UPF0339 family)
MNQSSFILFLNEQKMFQFRLMSSSGELLLESGVFKVKQACVSAIVGCKLQASSDRSYQRLKTKGGGYCFNLRLKNHEILAQSQEFGSAHDREVVIDTIKMLIQEATIDDRSKTVA